MKKFSAVFTMVVVLSLVVLVSVAMAAPAGGFMFQEGSAPSVPAWAVALLNAGLTWLITNGLKSLSKALPFVPTLEGPATALAGAIVGLVVVFANGLLGMIPAVYHPGVTALFTFAGTILAAYGVQGTVKLFLTQS